MSNFEDHFSGISAAYHRGRPTYPDELFEWLSQQVPQRELVWDVATGNGQAAVKLADYFHKIYASDASADQIVHAKLHPRVEYHVEAAESTSLPDNSVDMVTVAVGVHWFDFDRFYTEVKRVLKPGGVIAVWMYYFPYVDGKTEKIIEKLRREILIDYWPEQYRQHILTKYKDLPFPFKEIQTPEFHFTTHWNMQDLINFFHSWSGCKIFKEKTGNDPVDMIRDDLNTAWGDPEMIKAIQWELHVRAGKI